MPFDDRQISFMKRIGIPVDFSKPLTDSAYVLIEEYVSGYLQTRGFNEVYRPNEDGKMCEAILDLL